MLRLEHLVAATSLLLSLGCSSAPPTSPPTLGPDAPSEPHPPLPAAAPSFALASLAEAALPAAPARAWGEPVDVPAGAEHDGMDVQLTLPAGRVALRLSPTPLLGDDTRCFAIERVTLGATDWLSSGPDCLGCGLALARRPTEGFWLLSGGNTQQAATVGFSLVDCATGEGRAASALAEQGHPLRWQVLAPPPLPPEPVLEARLAFVDGVASLGGADGGLSLWRDTLDRVRAYLAAAGVQLVVTRLVDLPADGVDEVTSRAGNEEVLARWASRAAASLGAGAGEQYLPVVVVPCLVRNDVSTGLDTPVSGFTPRVPGGARADGRAEAVFLAGTCAPDDEPPGAPRLARVLAHEMGHYLGLFHSDSPAGKPLADPDRIDLMSSNVVYLEEVLDWAPRQREALRLHPILR